MYSRLMNFINKHKIFNKLQFGFRINIYGLSHSCGKPSKGLRQWKMRSGYIFRLSKSICYLINSIAMVYEVLHMNGS